MSLYTAEIAVNRFGLGAKDGELDEAKADPQGWLLAQIKPLALTRNFSDSQASIASVREYRAVKIEQDKLQAQNKNAMANKLMDKEAMLADEPVDPVKQLRRESNQKSMRLAMNTLGHHIKTADSFQARLLDFFSNHFSVTGTNFNMRAVAPTLEREAIAPHIAGHFADLLIAVEQHPAMLVYLNNEQSIGPDSRVGLKRKQRGLNENLAREILELHTLGVNSGYTQEDVKELAKAITGWSVSLKPNDAGFIFRRATHQPGKRSVVGKQYADAGVSQGEKILRDLAVHPATAAHMSFKIARHFIQDEPSDALVNALKKRWLETDGHLAEVFKAMVQHPHSWNNELQKIKNPREFLISACRACDAHFLKPQQLFDSLLIMGQAPFSAGSPAGFGDTSVTWDGAEALMSRIEWADQFVGKIKLPATAIAQFSLGKHLSRDTQLMVKRAESRQQALALLLMSPEFQRR